MQLDHAIILSIVIPTLDEAEQIERCLEMLQPWRTLGHEIIVVDGGSSDNTVKLVSSECDTVLTAPRGRASQMNMGAAAARGRLVIFLHADSTLPIDAEPKLRELASRVDVWGRFDVQLDGHERWCRVIGFFINLRSRMTGIATGDQAIFARRSLFNNVGRFPDLPLMEDIAISRNLRKQTKPVCLRNKVTTSSRRWREHGVVRTIITMWMLRLAYYAGVSPHRLKRIYDRR